NAGRIFRMMAQAFCFLIAKTLIAPPASYDHNIGFLMRSRDPDHLRALPPSTHTFMSMEIATTLLPSDQKTVSSSINQRGLNCWNELIRTFTRNVKLNS